MLKMRTLCTVTEGASGASIVDLVVVQAAARIPAASTATAKLPGRRRANPSSATAKERNIAAALPFAWAREAAEGACPRLSGRFVAENRQRWIIL
jgi:hypothetical protein